MKSGVTLWIDQGAVLTAVSDPRVYDRGNGRCGMIDDKGKACRPFILFDGTQGGGIVGDGAIDGRGGETMAGRSETWWQLARRAQAQGGKQNNPRLIEVDNARDITFYRIMLRNSPNFHVMLNSVAGATVWGVRIDTPADARNTDGIDPAASQDITIAHSFIRTGDDNIAIKAGNGPTRHVSIVNDHFYWGHGLSIGSETNAGVSDILVRDVTLDGTASRAEDQERRQPRRRGSRGAL
ncbi:glycoside hydrolase family 28 protein [Rhizobium sp. AN73]|uniref:glycoside hydrolase family 28 protein n=1 Tax=Rhizobium sp. AN73 TaxID=3035124 RepID=UPI002741E0D5|nr:glycosyl hydrolase family 28 protein [Rhizobium sp. AN73]